MATMNLAGTALRVLAHLSKSNSMTFQGPYEGYIKRTKLNQTGTFISIYKRHKLPQQGLGQSQGRKRILCTFEVRKKPSGTFFTVLTGSVTGGLTAF